MRRWEILNSACSMNPPSGKDPEGLNMQDFDLEEAYLSGASLKKANLSGSNLRYMDLSDAKVFHANLSWCLLNIDMIDSLGRMLIKGFGRL